MSLSNHCNGGSNLTKRGQVSNWFDFMDRRGPKLLLLVGEKVLSESNYFPTGTPE